MFFSGLPRPSPALTTPCCPQGRSPEGPHHQHRRRRPQPPPPPPHPPLAVDPRTARCPCRPPRGGRRAPARRPAGMPPRGGRRPPPARPADRPAGSRASAARGSNTGGSVSGVGTGPFSIFFSSLCQAPTQPVPLRGELAVGDGGSVAWRVGWAAEWEGPPRQATVRGAPGDTYSARQRNRAYR